MRLCARWNVMDRLMEMSEIEREELLAQRQEEMQRIQDKRNLEQMLKAQSGHVEDSVAKAAKRESAFAWRSWTHRLARATCRSWRHQGEVSKVGRAEGQAEGEGREEARTCCAS